VFATSIFKNCAVQNILKMVADRYCDISVNMHEWTELECSRVTYMKLRKSECIPWQEKKPNEIIDIKGLYSEIFRNF